MQHNKCLYCGIEFQPKQRTQKYCCDQHQRIHYRTTKQYTYICENCGEQYQTPNKDRNKYCSPECKFAHRGEMMCKYCGDLFVGSFHGRQKYCSNTCRMRAFKGIIEPLGFEKQCPQCGKKFIKGHSQQSYCSHDCMYQSSLESSAEERIAAHELRTFECKECGKSFVPMFGNKHRQYCSHTCLNKHNRRINKATRRARKESNGRVDRFSPLEILNRDGWRCQLCGTQTPKYLRGTIDDRAPELDHIVPLALGGSHTRGNTQCLCRKCNQEKGAVFVGQLRLGLVHASY